jgi:hypothetical protein
MRSEGSTTTLVSRSMNEVHCSYRTWGNLISKKKKSFDNNEIKYTVRVCMAIEEKNI